MLLHLQITKRQACKIELGYKLVAKLDGFKIPSQKLQPTKQLRNQQLTGSTVE